MRGFVLRFRAKARGRAKDVSALVPPAPDNRTVVTLMNLIPAQARRVIVQGGGRRASAAHRHERRQVDRIDSPILTVEIRAASGARLELEMKRYANVPTVKHPWQR